MLYPIKFQPILKEKIWGGTHLKALLNKPVTSDHIGESWELSGLDGNESVVSNGFLQGNNLAELIEIYMGDLVGDSLFQKFGLAFPLLFKFIDANSDLSIQVHPDDEVAFEKHNSYGKNEMWYIVDAEPGAELVVGFSRDITREEYEQAIESGNVEELHQYVPVKKGDVIYIPVGTVHAIGKGMVLAEIQQASDITYRVYDYKRKDTDGKERELHIEQALDVINFEVLKNPKTVYSNDIDEVNPLVSNQYFTINLIRFEHEMTRVYSDLDSFVVYMCTEGSFEIEYNGERTLVEKGETVLIPAIIDGVNLIPHAQSLILETYIEMK